jgi:DNA polymerase delta subunit 1
MSSNAYGKNAVFHDDLVGLIMLDGYILARKSVKVPSYKLSAFAEWVGEKKGDVTYMEMVNAFTTKNPALLREVADYCVQDSRLVPKILLRMEEPAKVIAMTRLASVPPSYTIKRGTSILTFGLIVAESFERQLIINPPPKVEGQQEGYQGATVIDPLRGYHKDPVAVLDFASLYPSIMQAFNICVSTFIKSFAKTEEVPAEYVFPQYSVIEIDGGVTAVFKRTGVEGVYPSILRVLLERRSSVKKQMKSLEPGTVAYNQANAKQLSLKISANSLYGYCGSPLSQLYERALAASVTSMGRQSLFQVRTTIQNLCKEGKIPPDVHVVYGDSVTGDTPLLIREKGRVFIKCIDEMEGDWEEYHGSKEAFVPSPPIQVWQDGGFTPILRVIRHTTKKSINPATKTRTFPSIFCELIE